MLRLALVVLALAATAPIGAQPPPPPERFPVDVRLVAVPVFVTTREGKAVPVLTAADFEIEDQGRKVPVAGFLAVDASAPAAAPELTGSRGLTAAARRQFLLLFDLTFSSAPGMLKAREAALAFLRKGPEPGDLIAVASFGPGGLDVRLGFTPDVLQAAHAVATLGGAEGARLRDPLGLAYDLGVPLSEGTGRWGLLLQPQPRKFIDLAEVYREQILQLSRAERDQYRQRVVQYVGELRRLALLLDSVQGRKQVMLLSGGFDQSVLMGAQSTEQAEIALAVTEGRLWEVQGDRHFGDSVARSGLDALYAALARSDTVVHTLDVGGLTAGARGALDEIGGETRGSGRETLAQIAGQSGGRFMREANDLAGAMRDVLDASRHYYVLAFAPADSRNPSGEPRKLRIKVKRPGLQVSHRAAYTLPDAKAATTAPTRRMQAAETIAKGLSGGAFRLDAVAMPYRSADGRLSLPIVLEIGGATLLAGGTQKPLALEIYGYAFDVEGQVLDAVGLTPVLDLTEVGASVQAKGLQVLTSFRVKEGPADLRFLVRDRATNRTGSLRLAVNVPSFAAGTLVVSPPLVMDDPRRRVVIPTPSQANPDLEIPFRLAEAPFAPEPAATLVNGQGREVCVMVHGPGADPPAIKAVLVRLDGTEVDLATGTGWWVSDPDGFRRVVASVTPAGVASGEYRLRVTVADASGRAVGSDVAVRVQ